MDITKVTNKEALNFLNTFFLHRNINKQYFKLIPEDKFDYRMVDTPNKKSDSPRESLAHQVNVENTFIQGIETGSLIFGSAYNKSLFTLSKNELLNLLEQADKKLIEMLSSDDNINKIIAVPWSNKGIRAIEMVWTLNSHEIFHTGWNIAVMDHLNIERFPELKQVWG